MFANDLLADLFWLETENPVLVDALVRSEKNGLFARYCWPALLLHVETLARYIHS